MQQTTIVAEHAASDYSPSPSPHAYEAINDIDIFKEDSPPPIKSSLSPKIKPDINMTEDIDDDSLHEMVQSILNDSDNDILNNLNGLGYNNIQYTSIHTNDNTASSLYTQSQSQLEPQTQSQNDAHIASKSAPSLHSQHIVHDDTKSHHDSSSLSLDKLKAKRKYVTEWRTVIFIRHGKSKWNAAEANTIGKVVAAGQGLWEYYKHKKLRQNNIKKSKSDVDIMDAPLSREGIMEALNLCGYLREYNTDKLMTCYHHLFENTRNEIDDILKDRSINDSKQTHETLQNILRRLDAFKIESLVAAGPPPDDDNLRLPPPVSLVVNDTQAVKEEDVISTNVEKEETLNTIDENNNMDERRTDTIVSLDAMEDVQNNKITKRYMEQITDPQNPMSAQYIIQVLNGEESKCGVVVSNLRRAMSTACICLKDRLQRRPYEKIQILGCLQEIGLNSDTRPLLFSKDHKPNLAKTEKTSPFLKGYNMKQLYLERLSTKYYKGDASDKTAQQRLQEFALWLFAQRKYLHVVCIGHSHWFQSFFKAYLPENIEENELPAKVRTAKIRNCGVVAFRIQKKYVPSKSKRHGRHISFEIAPNSITTLQFHSDCKTITNHEQRAEREKREREKADKEDADKEDDGVLALADEIESDEVESDKVIASPSLEQSVSQTTTQSPGIVAYIKDEQNETNSHDFIRLIVEDNNDDDNEAIERPPIPDNKPPPVPPLDDEQVINGYSSINEENKEEKDIKIKASTSFASSLTKKPKHWMTRAMNKFGGGEKIQKTHEKEREKEQVEEKEEEKEKEKEKQDDDDDDNDDNKNENDVEPDLNALTELLANVHNETDDEEYVT